MYWKVVKENKQLREYIIINRKKNCRQQKTLKKKNQKLQKYKQLVYQLGSDSATENIERMQQTSEKRNLKILDYLNSEQDGKEHRKWNKLWQNCISFS